GSMLLTGSCFTKCCPEPFVPWNATYYPVGWTPCVCSPSRAEADSWISARPRIMRRQIHRFALVDSRRARNGKSAEEAASPRPELVCRQSKPGCRMSIILLDWGVRESFHSLKYLNEQTVPRDQYEILWLEFYQHKPLKLQEMMFRHGQEKPLIEQ